MKQTAIAILMILMCVAFSQNAYGQTSHAQIENRTEIMSYLASLPDVSVTYITKSMLKRLPKDNAESPLTVLVDKGGVESIRVFLLGSPKSEAGGKKLIDAYVSGLTEPNYAELLMLQKNGSNEIIMYGFPIINDTSYYNTVLMYSKAKGKKAILIILTGKIHENVIGDLIDSFDK